MLNIPFGCTQRPRSSFSVQEHRGCFLSRESPLWTKMLQTLIRKSRDFSYSDLLMFLNCLQIITQFRQAENYASFLLLPIAQNVSIIIIRMGSCMSTTPRGRSGPNEMKALSTIPADTSTMNKTELPALRFSFLLEDIRVRRCEYRELSFKFKVEEVGEYATAFKKIDQNQKASWRFSHRMEGQLTEYDLRTRFLVAEALDRSKQVNLYLLWRGPYHLNLPIELVESKEARISFNFKISQGVHIQVENEQTCMMPKARKNEGEYYSFWIEPIISQQLEPAKYSYFLKISDGRMGLARTRSKAFQEPRQSFEDQKLEIDKNYSQKEIVEVYNAPSNKLVWQKEVAKQLHLPQIDTTLESYELRQTSLYLIFFNVVPGKQHTFEVDSSCYIPFYKMVEGDYKVWKDPKTKLTYHIYHPTLTHQLFHHGKDMGEAKVRLSVKVQHHEQQMMTCVRTERGVETETPIFAAKKVREGEEVKGLKKLHTAIQKDLMQLQKINHSNQQEVQEIMIGIKDSLRKVIKLISNTSKDSIMVYEYLNESQMAQGQKLLIDLGFKTLAYIKQNIHPQVEALSWQILLILLKRGQFALINLGFNRQEKELVINGKANQTIRNKIEVALSYLQLLNTLLSTTLKSLVSKGDQNQQNFVEAFCSYAYFRIPIFRDCILSIIKRPSDPDPEEWKAFITSMTVDSGQEMIEQQSFYSVKFNWENNFYKCLTGQPEFKGNQTRLQQTMEAEKGWKERLSKRRGAFFTFLQNLVQEIEYVTVVSKYIEWEYLPGYNKLLYAFLAEMKQMPVVQMTDRFKRCLLKILANERLLNVLVVMMVRKTNIYDVRATVATLSILDDIFKRLRKMDRSIASTFDYKFLLQGIKVVLESDYEFNISKALILLYNHFNYFSPQFSLELILFLMSRYFYKFFFHWSYNLRCVFHTLIFVKVHILREKEQGGSMVMRKKQIKEKNKGGPNQGKKTTTSPYYSQLKIFIIQRYQYLMGVIREEVLPSLQSENAHFGDSTLHKMMKVKLSEKKKKSNEASQGNMKVKKRDSSLAPARFFSAGISKKMIITKNKIYFKPEEMQVVKMTPLLNIYVKQAVAEYKALMEKLDKKYLQDPDYQPELVAKKMKDGKEKDLEENQDDEW